MLWRGINSFAADKCELNKIALLVLGVTTKKYYSLLWIKDFFRDIIFQNIVFSDNFFLLKIAFLYTNIVFKKKFLQWL